jgi:hypothetical protein
MILQQRMSYAEIELIRDYSQITVGEPPITEPPQLDEDVDNELEDFFGEFTLKESKKIKPVIGDGRLKTLKLSTTPKSGPKTKYYYNGDKETEYVSFRSLTKTPFFTTKERHIKRHYGNPFASISIVTHERTIDLRDNKLYLKTYTQRKIRDFNWKYFRKSSRTVSFTINLLTGDFTIGDKTSNGRVKNVRFRKNSFSVLDNLISNNNFFKFNTKIPSTVSSDVKEKFFEIFNDYEFVKEFKNFIPEIPHFIEEISDRQYALKGIIDFFITKKKIKVPNIYVPLIKGYYPTEKYLKKNDRKLIQSILDSFGIKSKISIKIAHENPSLNYLQFTLFCGLFGKDYMKYVGNLNPESIKFFCDSKNNDNTWESTSGSIPLDGRKFPTTNHFVNSISDNEKDNIIKIVNSLVNKNNETPRNVNGIFNLFKDHFEMIEKIIDYDPDFKMRATTYDAFHNEHMELSKMTRLIKKGWTTEYQFDNRMVRFVEEGIKTKHNDVEHFFNPVILKREEEYGEEGAFMHHCVASYADKETSIIISLRTDNNLDRVTCEFNKKTGDCIQERHFSNKMPPEYFKEPLTILKKRVKKFAIQRLLDHVDVKKVRIKINGKEVVKNEPTNLFDDLLVALNDPHLF